MMPLPDNPVYDALCSRDAHLGTRIGPLAWFDAEVSPFAGFPTSHAGGLRELCERLPAGRRILHASRTPVRDFGGWATAAIVEGLQFVYEGAAPGMPPDARLVPLGPEHAAEMVALAALTKPGPFDIRTIEFGNYYGVFDKGRLVAMTGQRLHPPGYAEISAVCTHPEHLGKGYAAALIAKQLDLIRATGDTPFLHVRADNDRAIALYGRLGFRVSGPMHFYFLRKTL
ncbi:MAG: GNAT family N-acetyltransferase [Chitinophagaceae bacterium]|nr:MAG: GNAT family N-acetyltransferase [Chitinophagaceae bacterium]